MSEEKIHVMAYSGYRGEETPRAILRRYEKIEVIEIISQWKEEGVEERDRKRFFIFKGNDGLVHKIFCDEKTAEWYYTK